MEEKLQILTEEDLGPQPVCRTLSLLSDTHDPLHLQLPHPATNHQKNTYYLFPHLQIPH